MRTIGEILTQLRRCPKRLLLFPLVLAVLYVLPGVLRNEIQQVVSEIDNVKNQVPSGSRCIDALAQERLGESNERSNENMKKISNFLNQLPHRPKRILLLPVLLIGLCILPIKAKADVADIILFLKQIETTLQNGIGKVLSEINTVEQKVNTIQQEIVWPLAAINQARGFVSATINHYKGLLNQIHTLGVASATLANPSHLETAFRSSASTALSTIQPAYTAVYSRVPQATNANPLDRNMMDMGDAAAMGSLKTSAISDQTSSQMLDLADIMELQAGDSAPGSAPLLATQAQIASLENEAHLEQLLAAELRLEATKLAHDNALLKRSADHKGTLQLHMQQVGANP